MDYPKYELFESVNSTIFEFTSVGNKGQITKIVKFTQTNNRLVYNLGFGDKVNPESSPAFAIDDFAISNNGDRNIILATIANAIYVFTEINNHSYVYFSGTSPSRIRLYRMAISNNFNELSLIFDIFGIVNDELSAKDKAVAFDPNIQFKGFLIKRR